MPHLPNSPIVRLATLALAGLIGILGAHHTEGQDTARQRLSSVFAREAARIVSTPFPLLPELEMATEMLQQSIELDPTNIEYRRRLHALATLSENEEVRRSTTADLAQLDPNDQSIRLARINDALSQHQTADELDSAYSGLLAEDSIHRIAPAIASRLAFDYAILKKRMGDDAAYGHWLGLATALDQTNKPAAAMAAGYFRMNANDPFAEGELLVNLLLADPTDLTTQSSLAKHLLDHGAYHAAQAMYQMTIDSHAERGRLVGSNLIADRALSLWAGGAETAALETIRRHKNELNRIHQIQAQINDPGLPPAERLQLRASFPPTLHAVQIAILDHQGDAAAQRAVTQFCETLQGLLDDPESPLKGESRVEVLLMQAWITLWFQGDTSFATSMLGQAEATQPFSDVARARFDGWIALRGDDLAGAEAQLQPIATDDVAARLGLGLVRLKQSRRRDAARLFLSVAREEPGTVMGVWAAKKLSMLIGQGVPPAALSTRLNDLIESLPDALLALPGDPTRVLTVRVEALKRRHRPFEPVLVRIVLTNNSNFPLGVGPHAAIKPQVFLQPRATIATIRRAPSLPPIVIDIDRFLRIEPRDTAEILIDLRAYYVGGLLDLVAVAGASLDLEATVNPIISGSNVEAGLLGSTRRGRTCRIDGVNRSQEWTEDVIGLISEPDTPEDTVLMALLAHAVAQDWDKPETDAELAAVLDHARTTLSQSWAKLDSFSQAWVLAVLPVAGDALEPILQQARSSQDPLVQLTFLLGHVHEADDPMLLAAERGEEGRVRTVALLRRSIRELQEAAATQIGGDGPEGN